MDDKRTDELSVGVNQDMKLSPLKQLLCKDILARQGGEDLAGGIVAEYDEERVMAQA